MRKTRCGRCHRVRLVYKVEGVLGWAELCHACREELRRAALSAARDEVVRAAVAWRAARGGPYPTYRECIEVLNVAVDALVKLAGGS